MQQAVEAPPCLRWHYRPNVRHVFRWFLQAAAAAVRAEMDAAEERLEAELKVAQDEAHIAAEQRQAAIAARCIFPLSKIVYRKLASDAYFRQTALQTLCFLMWSQCLHVCGMLGRESLPMLATLIIAGKQSKHASATWRQS